jgi:hypothetical protein
VVPAKNAPDGFLHYVSPDLRARELTRPLFTLLSHWVCGQAEALYRGSWVILRFGPTFDRPSCPLADAQVAAGK